MKPILEVDSIQTFYGETQALFGVSLRIAPGEVVCLLGHSGAGKTTTLRSILGLTPPRLGTITFDGRALGGMKTHAIARLGIGWVPEDRRVFPALTVAQNLGLGQKRTCFRPWTLREVIEIFPALDYLMERDCENLSGGEMQMVSIARALLGAPGLLLLDEPSQGLAPKIVRDVMGVVSRLKREGIAVLMIEQNAALALERADRAVVLRHGGVVHESAADELRGSPERLHALLQAEIGHGMDGHAKAQNVA